MVTVEHTTRTSLSIYDSDLTFLDKLHEKRSEAVRLLIKEYKRLKNMEYLMVRIMMIIISVLILGIGTFMDMFSFWGFILYVFGSCLLFGTFAMMIRDFRKKQKDVV